MKVTLWLRPWEVATPVPNEPPDTCALRGPVVTTAAQPAQDHTVLLCTLCGRLPLSGDTVRTWALPSWVLKVLATPCVKPRV